jgi:hypothetical protein
MPQPASGSWTEGCIPDDIWKVFATASVGVTLQR